MIPELPDIYETRQGHALREALDRGDTDEARRIIRHVLAESATNDTERAQLEDALTAALLFKLQTRASEAGRADEAEAIAALMAAMCSPRAILTTLAGAYLQAGLREGLPAPAHDQLMTWIGELQLGDSMRDLAATIRRLPAEETGR